MMGVKSGISSFLRRRRLVNATLALAVKPVVEALEPRQLLSASGDNISLDQLRYQWTHMPAVARHTLAVAEYVYPEFTAKLNVELDRLGLPRVEPEAGQLSTASNIGKAKTRHIRHHKPPQRHHKPKLHNLGRTPPAAPTVSGTPTFTYDPALPQQISVTFSENVSATTWANTLTLVNPNSSTSKFVSPTSASYNSTSHVATYSFSSTASLEDGNFAGVVHGWMISSVATGLPLVGSDGAAGDDFVTTGGGSFYFYDTDLTGNRATDIFDLNALLANFNTTGKAYSQGNASYDAAGNVDIFDLNLLLPKFNTSLANLGPASALTATSNSSGVQLSWTASTDTNVTSYDIFRDDVSGGLQLTGSITGTSYSDTSVSPGTYSYFVVARSSAGGTSFPTNLASTTFLSPTAASIAPDLSGIDGAPGGTAMGADGGDPASLGFSGAVHYSDGTVSVSSNDLDPAESGLISGHTRTWTDQAGVWVASNGLNGNNEVVSQWPVLQQESSGAVLSVSGGQTTRWFDSNGSGGFNERFYGQDSLSSDGSGGYNLVDSAGNKFNYFGLSGSLVLERGQLQSLTDPNGDITSFTYNSTTGTLTTVQRKRLSDSVVLEQLNYTYNSAGKVAAVEMDRLIGSTLTAVRTASYEYYDGSTPFGQAGALARVTITQGTSSGTVVNHELYRYDPSSGLLTYVVEGGSYEKFAADAGVSNPLTASNTIVSQYADEAFTYFGPADGTKNGKVKTQSLNGGTYTYQYDYLA
ncbi:MAG TPA: fibronectin type III domain-containing protein, partial [Tepidisphaeraceae bacterium]